MEPEGHLCNFVYLNNIDLNTKMEVSRPHAQGANTKMDRGDNKLDSWTQCQKKKGQTAPEMVRKPKENHWPTVGNAGRRQGDLEKAGGGICVNETLDKGLGKKIIIVKHL